jgi:hypothetical protein
MRFLKTKKLFYKKWPFKVECNLKGSSYIKWSGADTIIDWCNGKQVSKVWWDKNRVDTKELLEFATTVKPYLDKELQVRCEGNRFNLFCKDKSLLENMIKDLDKWVISVTEPENDTDLAYLTENTPGKVLCDSYPYTEYHYKIILRENMPTNTRATFLTWLIKYDGKIKIANGSLQWMEDRKRWMQDPFIYVKDTGTLTMVLLYLGNYAKRTHEFVLRSSINTPCLH